MNEAGNSGAGKPEEQFSQDSEGRNNKILSQLDAGEIDVEEALARLGDEPIPVDDESPATAERDETGLWASQKQAGWWILLASGLGLTALAGWLGTLGGWWWVCAAPSLLFGLIVLVLAASTHRAPWLQLRIETGQDSWPRLIRIGFPIPMGLVTWGLKNWGTRIPSLDRTGIDELLLALEGEISSTSPLIVEVDENKGTGERIRISLG
jgi:hypothetical protein